MRHCDFCSRGRLRARREDLSFRQSSDLGWIEVRLELGIRRCDACRMADLDPDADAAMEAAFRRAYTARKRAG